MRIAMELTLDGLVRALKAAAHDRADALEARRGARDAARRPPVGVRVVARRARWARDTQAREEDADGHRRA